MTTVVPTTSAASRSALRTPLGTLRLERAGQRPVVYRWTRVQVRALRLSVRDFARYLGVSDRVVSNGRLAAPTSSYGR